MPEMRAWEIDTFARLERAESMTPPTRDASSSPAITRLPCRRWFPEKLTRLGGNCQSLWPDFPLYGSVIEASECLTRLVGQEHALLGWPNTPSEWALS